MSVSVSLSCLFFFFFLSAKNGEQVAVRDDRGEEPGAWILARVLKYVPETHQYELKDDDDKEGIGMLTAPRFLVIRLEDNTKGVQRGERVLAVFPDTTSFYLGTVHRVSERGDRRQACGLEKRREGGGEGRSDEGGVRGRGRGHFRFVSFSSFRLIRFVSLPSFFSFCKGV